jgi:hypothetical protein
MRSQISIGVLLLAVVGLLVFAFGGATAAPDQATVASVCCVDAGCCVDVGDCCCVATGGECCLDGSCCCGGCECCVTSQ